MAGKVMLGLKGILVTSTYQKNDISLYNPLHGAMIETLLEVHFDKYSFFVLGLLRGTFNCTYDTAMSDGTFSETELMWQ
jgi:hypothetical protein